MGTQTSGALLNLSTASIESMHAPSCELTSDWPLCTTAQLPNRVLAVSGCAAALTMSEALHSEVLHRLPSPIGGPRDHNSFRAAPARKGAVARRRDTSVGQRLNCLFDVVQSLW